MTCTASAQDARTYRDRAVSEKAKGDLKTAIADFGKAIAVDPGDPAIYNDRGLAEYASGDLKSAIADFSEAINEKPDYAEAYSNRAGAKYAKGDIFGSRLDEAKAAELGHKSSSAGMVEGALDISLATCPTPEAARANGEPYRAYAGCALPGNQTAVFTLYGTRAMYIDGIAAYNVPLDAKERVDFYAKYSDSLALLPGHHIVRFANWDIGRGRTPAEHLAPETYVETGLDAAPGKAYIVVSRHQQNRFWVDISEFKNDPADLLQQRDTYLKDGDSAAALSVLESFLVSFSRDPRRKTIEDDAKKLRSLLNKAQSDAARAANSGPLGLPLRPVPNVAPKIPGCTPEEPQETTALPLTPRGPANRQSPVDLKLVLARATRYVEEYESQLGNLIGREVYLQTNTMMRPGSNITMLRSPLPGNQQQTESDFAILKVGKEWMGLRQVNCLNGAPVQPKTQDFDKVLENPSLAVLKSTLADISNESAHYNIGMVQRTTNLPTFALRVLRPGNTPRFEFRKSGEAVIGGLHTWAIGFRELQHPTLIQDAESHDEFCDGTLWIEPESGRVVKTELNVAGRQDRMSFHAQTVVSYKSNPKLAMLLPIAMQEHYTANGIKVLDCQADYFDFRRFQVETHLDFGPQIPEAPAGPRPAPPPRGPR